MKKEKTRGQGRSPIAEKVAPARRQLDDCELQDLISRRAYELYQERGCEDGHECEDWLLAESEILREIEDSLAEPMKALPPSCSGSAEAKISRA